MRGDGGVTDFDFGEGGFELADAAGDDDDVCAFGCEFLCDAEAHSLRGTGDEDGLEVLVSLEVLGSSGGAQRTLPSTGILLPPKRPIVEATANVTRGIARASRIVAQERPMEVVEKCC